MRYEIDPYDPMPVYVLERALQKLLKYGMDTFELFCDEANICYADRNRIIAKAKVAYGRTEFFEMPIPKDLKGERWHFYTKICGYSNKKAKELLAIIDKSHENQFIPNIKNFDVLKGV